MAGFQLVLLGSPHIKHDEVPIRIDRRKALALLAYLAVVNQPLTRDALATLFWPDSPRKAALNNLRRVLWSINQATPEPLLDTDRLTVSLTNTHVDVIEFGRILSSISRHRRDHSEELVCDECTEQLKQAIDLHGDYFLVGFTLEDCPEFDNWQTRETERIRREYLAALEQLVDVLYGQNNLEQALTYARRWVDADPTNEDAHRSIIQLYLDLGQRQLAEQQLASCRVILMDELDAKPSPETVMLLESRATQPSAELPLTLPGVPNSIVGRSYEVDEIHSKLTQPQCRLLTLSGEGGVGKTTLALVAADGLSNQYPDGCAFVDLAAADEEQPLVEILIDALSIPLFGNRDPWTHLIAWLQNKSLLLLLDNFEHLIDQAPEVSRVLQHAPQVQLLVTSRERLRLREEWVMEVGGLIFPRNEHATADRYDAVQLFLARAQQADGQFFASPEDMALIGRICQFVEGLPLAIELAAAWVRVLSVEEIVDELNNGLELLTHPHRNVQMRHQSLKAVFDHSWRTMTSAEQHLFQQLSVFRGTFDRHAARQIAGATLPVLAGLVDKSLLLRTDSGQYRISEVVRQYAEELLALDAAAKAAVEARHSAHYIELVCQHSGSLYGNAPRQAVEAIEEAHGNVRRAWRWAAEQSDIDQMERALFVLSEYLEIRGRFAEAVRLFALAAMAVRSNDTVDGRRVHALLLSHQAYHHARLGAYDHAEELLQQALQRVEKPNAAIAAAFARWQLGYVNYLRGRYDVSSEFLLESEILYNEVGDIIALAKVHNMLGMVCAALGEYTRSGQHLERSIDYCQRINYRRYSAVAILNLGNVAGIQGEFERCQRLFERSLAISQDIDDRYGSGMVLLSLAELALVTGRAQDALVRYRESLDLQREIGHGHGTVIALLGLGRAHRAAGDLAMAAYHLQEGLTLSQRINALPMTMECLVSLAEVHLDSERAADAIELAAHVASHPESDQETRRRAENVLELAVDVVDSADFSRHKLRGEETTLATLVASSL